MWYIFYVLVFFKLLINLDVMFNILLVFGIYVVFKFVVNGIGVFGVVIFLIGLFK